CRGRHRSEPDWHSTRRRALPRGGLPRTGLFLHSPPPMRRLAIAVAGSFCPGWVWLVILLLFTGASGEAQTVEVAAEKPAFTDTKIIIGTARKAVPTSKATVAQVTVVTERNRTDEAGTPLPPSDFNPDPGA